MSLHIAHFALPRGIEPLMRTAHCLAILGGNLVTK
jgi:hypothetical protein